MDIKELQKTLYRLLTNYQPILHDPESLSIVLATELYKDNIIVNLPTRRASRNIRKKEIIKQETTGINNVI